VKTLPGVEVMTLGTIAPFSNSIGKTPLVIEGWQPKPGENLAVDNTGVGPGYHEALGIPLVAGRGFTERDNANAPGVAIVNETFARTFFPIKTRSANRSAPTSRTRSGWKSSA
jgi:putative ABC transport system permease protein